MAQLWIQSESMDALLRLAPEADLESTLRLLEELAPRVIGCDAAVACRLDSGEMPSATLNLQPERCQDPHSTQWEDQTSSLLEWASTLRGPTRVTRRDSESALLERSRFASGNQFQTCIVIPLSHKENSVGVVFAYYSREFDIDPNTKTWLRALTHQASNALGAARRVEQLRARHDRELRLHQATNEIAVCPDLSSTLEKLASKALELLPRPDTLCFAYFMLAEAHSLRVVAVAGGDVPHRLEESVRSLSLRPNQQRGIVGRALMDGRTMNIPDVHDPGNPATADYLSIARSTRSQLSIPVVRLGVLTLEHPTVNAFDPATVDLLETLARLVAEPIRRARAQERLERATQLTETAAAIVERGISGWAPSARAQIQYQEGGRPQTANAGNSSSPPPTLAVGHDAHLQAERVGQSGSGRTSTSPRPPAAMTELEAFVDAATQLLRRGDASKMGGVLYLKDRGRLTLARVSGPAANILQVGHNPGRERGLATLLLAGESDCKVENNYPSAEYQIPEVAASVSAAIAVPLRARGRRIGALVVYTGDATQEFDEREDGPLLTGLARLAAVAIDEAQLRERGWALAEASMAFSQHLDPRRVADLVLSKLQELVGYHRATVQVLDGDERRLFAWSGFEPAPSSGQRKLHRAISQDELMIQVLQRREVRIVSDTCKEPLFDTSLSKDVRSWIAVPLVVRDNHVVGLLTLDDRREGTYTDDLKELLEPFAATAAAAIEKSLLAEARLMLTFQGLEAAASAHEGRRLARNILYAVNEVENACPHRQNQSCAAELVKIRQLANSICPVSRPSPPNKDTLECFSANEWLNEHSEEIRRVAGVNSVDFSFGVSDDVKVRSDRVWLERVCRIVVDNAFRAMQERWRDPVHRRLRVSTRFGRRRSRDGGAQDYLVIRFGDNGPGIREELKTMLFRRHVARSAGFGIGLFAASEVLSSIGAAIEDGEPNGDSAGMGANIDIYLPCAQ